ncbi:MAG: DUF4345 domain-containing protein [Spirochaetales bacterium]|jgi:hypothetical protein
MKKAYLIVVAGTLALIGLVFIAAPGAYLAGISVSADNSELLEVLRGFGGFYLGFAAYLFLVFFRRSSIDTAIQSIVIVMSGILIGRLTGIIADGSPDPKLIASAGIELAFAIWGIVLILRTKEGKGNGAAHQSH